MNVGDKARLEQAERIHAEIMKCLVNLVHDAGSAETEDIVDTTAARKIQIVIFWCSKRLKRDAREDRTGFEIRHGSTIARCIFLDQ